MDYAAPYRGNFIPSIECLEKVWEKRGKLVYLLPSVAKNIQWVQDLMREGKRVYFIDRSFFSRKIRWANVKQLKDIVQKEKISVIHTHFVASNYSLWIYSKIFGSSIRIIANLHNHYEESGQLALLKRWVIRNTVDCFIGDSESVTQSASRIASKGNIVTIRNSIQFQRLQNYRAIDLHAGDYESVILMFGYPWYRKGVDVVVQALHDINIQKHKRVKLVIALAGGEADTREGIGKRLDHCPDWVEFLPPIEDLASYYNAADIFVSSGREEGLTYSPIEAAYCDCSVICSRINGNPLDIPHMATYEPESAVELQKVIENEMNQSVSEKDSIKKIQREYVLDHYDLNKWANEVVRCWE